MSEYLNAREVLGRLKMGKVADFTQSYFSQMVRDGVVPFHRLPGKKRKMFIYDEVKEALVNARDPSRDPQREANARRRQQVRTLPDVWSLIPADFKPDQFSIPEGVDMDEVEQEIITCNTTNAVLAAFASELLRALPAEYHDRIMEASSRHAFGRELLQDTIALIEEED